VAEGRARMEGGRTILSNVASGSEGVLMVPGSASESIDIESLARMTP
jgi:phosphoribosylglycinamide formyltransferase 1